jgi:hypothetical protein
MSYYEIQVLISDDSTSPMTRIDRCTLTAGNLADAATAYAALFTSDQARSRPAEAPPELDCPVCKGKHYERAGIENCAADHEVDPPGGFGLTTTA